MSKRPVTRSRRPDNARERALLLMALGAAALVLGMRLSHYSSARLAAWAGGDASLHPALMLSSTVLRMIGDPLQRMEWQFRDFIHRNATPAPARGDVLVLGVDDASLDVSAAFPEDLAASPTLRLMQQAFPWSRAVYADAAERILAGGAKAVIIDFAFTGPHFDAAGDHRLAEVLKAHPGKILLGANFAETIATNGQRVAVVLKPPWEGFNSAQAGFYNYWPDEDNVVRSVRHYYSRYEQLKREDLYHLEMIPSLVAAALKATGQDAAITADVNRHWPRFSSAAAYPPYSFHEMFVPAMWEQNFDKGAVFKNRYVFIGPAAPHMQDFHATPVGRLLGVQLHAQTMGAALNGAWLHHVRPWVSLADILLASLVAWTLVAFWKRPISTMLLLLVFSGLSVVIRWWLFDRFNLVTDGVAPTLAFNLAGLAGVSYDFMLERRQKLQLRNTLSRYFSPDLAEEILRDPERFYSMAGGTSRTVTVLFSDVRGFTTLSETLPPKQLLLQLNQYLERMVEVIFGNRGSIDKFIGDAIMAVWGRIGKVQDEAALKEEAVNAVTTALRMRGALADLNRQWLAEGLQELQAGIGIHQGDAVVGNIGSTTRMEFTVIGDSVNTASRLEGTTKEYGVDLIISDSVHARVKDRFICRSADLVKVKGKTVPVGLYTVIHEAEHGTPPGFEGFESGVRLYREGRFNEARAAFVAGQSTGMDDELSRLYVSRCDMLIQTSPPESWDGVYTFKSK